jgi:hypothetical protein
LANTEKKCGIGRTLSERSATSPRSLGLMTPRRLMMKLHCARGWWFHREHEFN